MCCLWGNDKVACWHLGVVVTAAETAGQHDLFTAEEEFVSTSINRLAFLWRTTVSFTLLACHVEQWVILDNPRSCQPWSARHRNRICVCDGDSGGGRKKHLVCHTFLLQELVSPLNMWIIQTSLCVRMCVLSLWNCMFSLACVSRCCGCAKAVVTLRGESRGAQILHYGLIHHPLGQFGTALRPTPPAPLSVQLHKILAQHLLFLVPLSSVWVQLCDSYISNPLVKYFPSLTLLSFLKSQLYNFPLSLINFLVILYASLYQSSQIFINSFTPLSFLIQVIFIPAPPTPIDLEPSMLN